MAESQWWLLIVGLIVGGTVVALLTAGFQRTDADLAADEIEAEATFIANHLGGVDQSTVATVLEAHREYLGLPAPDAILPGGSDAGAGAATVSAADRHPDDESDDVGHAGRRGADRDLTEA